MTNALATIDRLMTDRRADFMEVVPAGICPKKLTRIALSTIRTTPGLHGCKPQSLVSAVMTACAMGLEPGQPKQGWLIPQGTECRFEPGYEGMITMLCRDGGVLKVDSEVVRERDEWSHEAGRFWHKRDPFALDRGKKVGAWATALMKGGIEKTATMQIEQLNKIRDRLSNGQKKRWSENPEEFWKKTAIRRLFKTMALSGDLGRGLAALEEHEKELGDYEDAPKSDVAEDTKTGLQRVMEKRKLELAEAPPMADGEGGVIAADGSDDAGWEAEKARKAKDGDPGESPVGSAGDDPGKPDLPRDQGSLEMGEQEGPDRPNQWDAD